MPLQPALLAKQLWDLNGPVLNAQGVPQPPTPAMLDYAKGFCEMVKAAVAAFVPGTVSGSAPPGGPLSAGKGTGGKFTTMIPAVMSGIAAKSNPAVAPQVVLEATVIAAYLLEAGLIQFTAGSVTGNSTETSNSPGPLVAGTAKLGKVAGLAGPALSAKAKAALGATGPTQDLHYTTLVNFVMQNAFVNFATGTVAGTMSGGQLTAGTAAGGKAS